MVGFLDGINDSLKTANPIETMEEDTVVSLAFVCTASRNSPVQFARRKRSEEMIHVRAEVERNINSAVERTHKNQITGGMY